MLSLNVDRLLATWISSRPPAATSGVACRARGIPCVGLPSAGGRDAMYLAEIAGIGMPFVRCREGTSHDPAEFVGREDIGAGTTVLAETAFHLVEE